MLNRNRLLCKEGYTSMAKEKNKPKSMMQLLANPTNHLNTLRLRSKLHVSSALAAAS
jgi:hypothetical protein